MPVNLGPCSAEQLLAKSCLEIQKYMQRDPDNLNFSTVVVCQADQE